MRKKVLLGAEFTHIEPLGLFYLSSIAKQEGWEPKIVLSHGPDYHEMGKAIEEFNPDMVGFTVYTGNHPGVADLFARHKQQRKDLTTIVGGPHPTYFPLEAQGIADFVVVGEGLNGFRRVLRGEAEKGIVPFTKRESFPLSDRERFYEESPVHKNNPIKNVVTSTGCPYSCTHCYNSNSLDEIEGFSDIDKAKMQSALGTRKRFFPYWQRPVDDVLAEIDHVMNIAPATKFLFLEDDVFGVDMKWLAEFVDKYKDRPKFHANMRFETIDPINSNGEKRISLIKQAGCTGFSLAIESGIPEIRDEVLARRTSDEAMFRAAKLISQYELKSRTYQMLALPYGATKVPTLINLDADLKTLEVNVKLKQETGVPTAPWASTLAPYEGTRISTYCKKHGFYTGEDEILGAETYRIESVLRHVKRWVGPTLSSSSTEWLPQSEQQEYRRKVFTLMNYFPMFALMPNGHEMAREFLESSDHSPERLISQLDPERFHDFPGLIARYIKQPDKTSAGLNKAFRSHLYSSHLFT